MQPCVPGPACGVEAPMTKSIVRAVTARALQSLALFGAVSACGGGDATGPETDTPLVPRPEYLFFTSGRNGNLDIYGMAADGSAQTRLTTADAVDQSADWSPFYAR